MCKKIVKLFKRALAPALAAVVALALAGCNIPVGGGSPSPGARQVSVADAVTGADYILDSGRKTYRLSFDYASLTPLQPVGLSHNALLLDAAETEGQTMYLGMEWYTAVEWQQLVTEWELEYREKQNGFDVYWCTGEFLYAFHPMIAFVMELDGGCLVLEYRAEAYVEAADVAVDIAPDSVEEHDPEEYARLQQTRQALGASLGGIVSVTQERRGGPTGFVLQDAALDVSGLLLYVGGVALTGMHTPAPHQSGYSISLEYGGARVDVKAYESAERFYEYYDLDRGNFPAFFEGEEEHLSFSHNYSESLYNEQSLTRTEINGVPMVLYKSDFTGTSYSFFYYGSGTAPVVITCQEFEGSQSKMEALVRALIAGEGAGS